jgi:3-oxoacyl-[acyl-carrier-protein] synthase I
MSDIHIAGSGLACALGLDVTQCVGALKAGGVAPGVRHLPGGLGGEFPYRAIPLAQPGWYQRACEIVLRVAEEAGAAKARDGALFIATSSFDIGAVEPAAVADYAGDYRIFVDQVAAWLKWRGSVYALSTACTSSLNALIAAQALLDSGATDQALIIGIELDNCLTLGGFAALQLLSRTRCKPFGVGRDGLVLGEAVAALRLSTRESCSWRMRGGANVIDGSQATGASASALAAMYQRALTASGVAASEIDLIKVQAAGSPSNDQSEAQALRAAFGRVPPLVSLKAAVGHTMGASGAAEIALLTACLDRGVWPAVADAVDPDLGVVLAERAPELVRRVMATILGFGGGHASVVLERT